MKDAISFVSKALKKDDVEFPLIHLCYDVVQTQTPDGLVTLSHPLPNNIEALVSVHGLTLQRGLEICDYPELSINDKKNQLIIKKDSFVSRLKVTTDYTPRIVKKKQLKKAKKLPEAFISTIRKMTAFTVKNSDNQFAASVNIINKRLFATNNISVLRTNKNIKIKMDDLTIPRPLLNMVLKIKKDPVGIIYNERETVITYNDGSWAYCPSVTELTPDLGAVFDRFEEPTPTQPETLKALQDAILMDLEGEISCKKHTLKTDNCSIDNVQLKDFKVDTDNLEMMLKVFDNINMDSPFSFFSNDTFDAILAGRS